MKTRELYIGSVYLAYLINGDASVFDYYDDEVSQSLLDDLEHDLYTELGAGHFDVDYDSFESTTFRRCDATGAYMECALVRYVYHGA